MPVEELAAVVIAAALSTVVLVAVLVGSVVRTLGRVARAGSAPRRRTPGARHGVLERAARHVGLGPLVIAARGRERGSRPRSRNRARVA